MRRTFEDLLMFIDFNEREEINEILYIYYIYNINK